MNTKKYTIQLGESALDIDVENPMGDATYFVFALHKSGSVLLNAMVREMAAVAKVPFVDVPGLLFSKGFMISEVSNLCGGVFAQEGVCFGGFRHIPPPVLGVKLTKESRSVLLVRDPRDMLVSHYFSMLKSHSIPQGGKVRDFMLGAREQAGQTSIDAYVVEKADFFVTQFIRYDADLLRDHSERTKIYRYEDVIFEKVSWLSDMNDWFGWGVDHGVIQSIATTHDLRPEHEDTAKHVRRVVPGDHREKLQPETIATLNEMFRPVVGRFGYNF